MTVQNYALVSSSGAVENIIVWDGVQPYEPPAGTTAVAILESQVVGIGYSYSAGVFTAPAAPAAPPLTLAQQATALLADGITITSSGTPAINGTYAVASGVPFGQEDIATEAQFISTYSEFTNGQTTNLSWPLLTGASVIFPTTAEFLAFAKVAAQFVAAVKLAVLTGSALPAATATII